MYLRKTDTLILSCSLKGHHIIECQINKAHNTEPRNQNHLISKALQHHMHSIPWMTPINHSKKRMAEIPHQSFSNTSQPSVNGNESQREKCVQKMIGTHWFRIFMWMIIVVQQSRDKSNLYAPIKYFAAAQRLRSRHLLLYKTSRLKKINLYGFTRWSNELGINKNMLSH